MIQALVFDFDGLMIDTETPDFTSWQEIYQTYGGELTLEEWSVCIGKAEGDFDPYAILEAQIGRTVERNSIRKQRRARYVEMVEAQEPLPGVLDYLEAAQAAGFRIGMATSSSEGWALGHLQRLQIDHYFEVIHTAADVAHAKPDPALYRITAEALGIPPHQALALEDSQNGMLSAKGAGLYCAVVPNGMTEGLDFTGADVRLNSLADKSLKMLCEQLLSGNV